MDERQFDVLIAQATRARRSLLAVLLGRVIGVTTVDLAASKRSKKGKGKAKGKAKK